MDIRQKEKYIKLGLNIAYYRKLNKYTQLELCEKIDIERSHLSKIELGNVGVSLDIIFRMSDVFDIPVARLFEFRD